MCPFSLMAPFRILEYLVALLKELKCIQNYHTFCALALYHCAAIWIELFLVLSIMFSGGKLLPHSRKHSIFHLCWFSAAHYSFFLSFFLSLSLPSFPPFSPSFLPLSLPTLSFFLSTCNKLYVSCFPETSLLKLLHWTDITITEL